MLCHQCSSNGQLVTTLLGTSVNVTIDSTGMMVYIDNAMVTVADVLADNGVVHVIDAVLFYHHHKIVMVFLEVLLTNILLIVVEYVS